MKIAIYSLTRERLHYTRVAFDSLKVLAGHEYRHFVVDNGSEDQTALWLAREYRPFWMHAFPTNQGISRASNFALDAIFRELPDVELIVKMDNDCRVVSPDLLASIADLYTKIGRFESQYVLSPKVEGIHRQPTRGRETQIDGRLIGLTAIVGGLFHCVPASVYRAYRYPVTDEVRKAWGQDDHFCKWFKRAGGQVGYIEDLTVEHIEGTSGQNLRYPQYFERKWKEEKEPA